MKPANKLGIAALLWFVLGGGWFWQTLQQVLHQPAVVGLPVVIEINKGDSFTQVTDKLLAQHVQITPFWFKLIAFAGGSVKKLKIGEYELAPGATAPDILAQFVLGKTKHYALTIPEGWCFKELLQELARNPHLEHTLTTTDGPTVMAQLGTDIKHPEGEFFPDTYFFEKHTTDVALLKRAYTKMQQVLQEEWQHRGSPLPINTPYEALILASIVEKETAVVTERPQIAGVFARRLQTGMMLQTDPTVIYGMAERYQGNITRVDLKTPTPYNTYTIKGLPPTPIALPGRLAIYAALHPDPGDALYFVARGDGTHVFSASLKDHNLAVDSFQRKKK